MEVHEAKYYQLMTPNRQIIVEASVLNEALKSLRRVARDKLIFVCPITKMYKEWR